MTTFFRDVISLDWDDLAALLVGVSALIAVFRVKRSHRLVREEKVDADVLSQFNKLHERIGALEVLVRQQTFDIDKAHADLREMRKLEAMLKAEVDARESRIKGLEASLGHARRRIRHLETILERAGIKET